MATRLDPETEELHLNKLTVVDDVVVDVALRISLRNKKKSKKKVKKDLKGKWVR